MKHTTKSISTVAAAGLLLATLLTGCTNTSASDGSTSAAVSGSSGGAKIAACMREKGYDMADPKSDADTLSPPEGVDRSQWERDFAACSGASGSGAGEGFQSGGKLPAAAAREAAECIRDAGFGEFPDGDSQQEQYLMANEDNSALMAASDKCFGEAWSKQGIGEQQ